MIVPCGKSRAFRVFELFSCGCVYIVVVSDFGKGKQRKIEN